MEVDITQEQESQLAHLALRDGKADVGEFIEEDEMGLRFEQMLQA